MPLNILCDENISGAVIASLQEWGFNVASVVPSTSDPEIAARARREERIILTHDSDFASILAYPPKEFPGIIRIKVDPAFNELVIPALKRIFDHLKTAEDFRGKLIIALANSFRIWPPAEE